MRFLAIKKKKKYTTTIMSLENIHLFIKQTIHIPIATLYLKQKTTQKQTSFEI